MGFFKAIAAWFGGGSVGGKGGSPANIPKIEVHPPPSQVPQFQERAFQRVGEGAAFRKKGDGPLVIRFKHTHLKGFHRIVAKNAKLAGISQPDRIGNVKAFLEAETRRLTLERFPDSPHDPNSIRVIGHWGAEESGQLGWIAADLAKELAETVPAPVELVDSQR